MFQFFLDKKSLSITILSLLLLSIICQIMIGAIYQRLIRETENLSTTANKQLKQCKLKFQNCYRLNGSVPNIAVFVDKFIGRLTFARISLNSLKQVSTQLVMLSVFMCGIGACIGIIGGEILFYILPYYLVGLVGLYLYFSIAAIVDISGRKENLKTNLVDYLENHLLSRLQNNQNNQIEGLLNENESISARETIKRNPENPKTSEIQKEHRNHKESRRHKALTESGETIKETKRGQSIDAALLNFPSDKPPADRFPVDKFSRETVSADPPTVVSSSREKELKAAIAAFSEEEIEELLKELII